MSKLAKAIIDINEELLKGATIAQLKMLKGVVKQYLKIKEEGGTHEQAMFTAQVFYADNMYLFIDGTYSEREGFGISLGGSVNVGAGEASGGLNYQNNNQEGFRIQMARNLKTPFALQFEYLSTMKVEELTTIMMSVGSQIEELEAVNVE